MANDSSQQSSQATSHTSSHGSASSAPKSSGPELGLLGKAYLPAIAKGMLHTLGHIIFGQKNTMNYPDVKRAPFPGYRGEHRLTKDAQGREKCVACFMCSTVCPAHCIEIVAEPSPWPDREKRPKIFNIDMMRCIYCGMCEWACPCEAIELTEVFNVPSRTRQEKIYTKERLLSN